MSIALRPLTLCFLSCGFQLASAIAAQAQSPAPPAASPQGFPLPAPIAAPADAQAALGKTSPLADPPDWPALGAQFSKVLSAKEFDDAWQTLYSDAYPINPPWLRSPDSLDVSTGLLSPTLQRISFRTVTEQPAKAPRYWRKASELEPIAGRPVLSDLRIALDPGHIGGAYAKIEERWLSFREGEAAMEGQSTLQVALALKKKLEALGAQVFLVRETEQPVTSARPADFRELAIRTLREMGIEQPVETYAGLEGPAKMNTIQWQAEKYFYRVSEIRERGKKVNDLFKPDLVICPHLNAEPWGSAAQPQFSPVNHFHVLINGAYMADEIQQQDVRHEMLQRIFSRVVDEEIPLAEAIAKGMADTTKLPPYTYTRGAVRRVGTSGYVYARNLLANRLYRCPVIYLEPYVMNNQETYNRMLLGHYQGRTLVNGRLTTSLIEDYAEGIARGLVDYYRAKRRS